VNVQRPGLRGLQTILATLFLLGCVAADRRSAQDDGAPRYGGTVHMVTIVRSDDLWPAASASFVFRLVNRTLLAFPSDSVWERTMDPVPDIAMALPTRGNGGISADGLTYVFHLRDARWDTDPPRRVTAHDFVRAFKLACATSLNGVSETAFESITGFAEYCRAIRRTVAAASPANGDAAAALRSFLAGNALTGIAAPNESTLVIRLTRPTSELFTFLAFPETAPVPVEWLNWVPGSDAFQSHHIALGPYRVGTRVPGRLMVLARNPAWDPRTDAVRRAYVDSVVIHEQQADRDAMLQVRAGAVDFALTLPTGGDIQDALSWTSARVDIVPPGQRYAYEEYIAFNMLARRSPVGHLAVRKAVAYAANKAMLVRMAGGSRIAAPQEQAVLDGGGGWIPGYAPYATPGASGDVKIARSQLADAGYRNPISLTLATSNLAPMVRDAQALQAALARAGIAVTILTIPDEQYWNTYLRDTTVARRGSWDVALLNWWPDYWTRNNGRDLIPPLFSANSCGQRGVNAGCYANAGATALMEQAMRAASDDEALGFWQRAAALVMEDAAIVPLLQRKTAWFSSLRVRNCFHSPLLIPSCDIASAWLADAPRTTMR
jgi:peptide/nickel transport system substrate-binding protein